MAVFAAFLTHAVAMTAPLFAQSQDVPSVVDSAPSPQYAAAVERAYPFRFRPRKAVTNPTDTTPALLGRSALARAGARASGINKRNYRSSRSVRSHYRGILADLVASHAEHLRLHRRSHRSRWCGFRYGAMIDSAVLKRSRVNFY